MNLRLIVRPEAEADITNAALWYDSRELVTHPRLLDHFVS